MSHLQQLLKHLPPIKSDLPRHYEVSSALFPLLPNEVKNKVCEHVVSNPRFLRIYDLSENWVLQSPEIGMYYFDLSLVTLSKIFF